MKKENFKTKFAVVTLALWGALSVTPLAYAQGDKAGGGGDASEMRVNYIRGNILNWILKGNSKALHFDDRMPYESYVALMSKILQPHYVHIGFTLNENDVTVDGSKKTCKSFLSLVDQRPEILCHLSRFAKMKEEEQFSLVHHEYAGLAGVELNQGADSDYSISDQIPRFLLSVEVKTLGDFELFNPAKSRVHLPENFKTFIENWRNSKPIDESLENKLMGKPFACIFIEGEFKEKDCRKFDFSYDRNASVQVFPALGRSIYDDVRREFLPGNTFQISRVIQSDFSVTASFLTNRNHRLAARKQAVWANDPESYLAGLFISDEVRITSEGNLIIRSNQSGHDYAGRRQSDHISFSFCAPAKPMGRAERSDLNHP